MRPARLRLGGRTDSARRRAGTREAPGRSAVRRLRDHLPPPSIVALPRSHAGTPRSEEHTSELQSHSDLVCRLLLEKKKKKKTKPTKINKKNKKKNKTKKTNTK